MYRNGVAYFERHGQFEGDELTFGVKAPDVGDFLSSLTAVERGEGRVRSVAFAVPEAEEADEEESADGGVKAKATEEDERVDVSLHFADDDEHDVAVAYVIGSPIWRPAYRVLTDDEGALLQAWAVVQNTSGEDWENVMVSLSTGAPIAFRSDLGTPVTPPRPLVTDTGEVITAVPGSQTALAQEEAPEMELAADSAPGIGGGAGAAPMSAMKKSQATIGTGSAALARPSPAAMEHMLDASLDNRQRYREVPAPLAPAESGISVEAAASVSVITEGVTRYDLAKPVTIPDGGSTMIAVLSQRVPGNRAYLYAPEGGVALSYQHPFAVARVQNTTDAILERGPISVYGKGSFLGQGVMETLPRGATTFVPFSLDRSLVVQPTTQMKESEGKLIKVNRGHIVVERFSQRKTTYAMQNGGEEPAKVYLKHYRWGKAELVSPPAETEITADSALIPVTVPARNKLKHEVIEQTPVERTVDFMSDVAAEAVALYLKGPAVDQAAGAALQQALTLREQIIAAQARSANANRQRQLHRESAAETRENLKSLKDVERAGDLKKRLTDRLSDLDGKIAALTATIVEADNEVSELRVRLSEVLQDVTLDTPKPPKGA